MVAVVTVALFAALYRVLCLGPSAIELPSNVLYVVLPIGIATFLSCWLLPSIMPLYREMRGVMTVSLSVTLCLTAYAVSEHSRELFELHSLDELESVPVGSSAKYAELELDVEHCGRTSDYFKPSPKTTDGDYELYVACPVMRGETRRRAVWVGFVFEQRVNAKSIRNLNTRQNTETALLGQAMDELAHYGDRIDHITRLSNNRTRSGLARASEHLRTGDTRGVILFQAERSKYQPPSAWGLRLVLIALLVTSVLVAARLHVLAQQMRLEEPWTTSLRRFRGKVDLSLLTSPFPKDPVPAPPGSLLWMVKPTLANWAIPAITLTCLGVSLIQSFAGVDLFDPPLSELVTWGGLSRDLFHAQPWRVVTFQFLHSGAAHLISNFIGLYMLSMPTEKVMRAWVPAIVFIAGGIAGGVSSLYFRPNAVLVGASGGILAYAAFRVCAGLITKASDPVGLIFGSLVLGSSVLLSFGPGVSGVSHLGGAGAGACLGLVARWFGFYSDSDSRTSRYST